jgi:hypothetical protein
VINIIRSLLIAAKYWLLPKMMMCSHKRNRKKCPYPSSCSIHSLLPNQLSVQSCRVAPDWDTSFRCPGTILAPSLVPFSFSRCSNAIGASLGNFPFYSSPSRLPPSGPFCFASIQQMCLHFPSHTDLNVCVVHQYTHESGQVHGQTMGQCQGLEPIRRQKESFVCCPE